MTLSNAYWMPFTAMGGFKKDPRTIVGAESTHLIGEDGRRVFDSLSGLWCCGFGHNRPEIAAAVNAQLQKLDYAPAFQYTHPGAEKLAERLAQICPGDLNHVFFTNSGSEAADTSLKIARAYWRMRGQPSKTRFVGRVKGYHGTNFAGTSLGGIGPNRRLFGHLADADHLPHTLRAEDAFTKGQPQGGEELAEHLEQIVMVHGADNIAAVIVEPMSGSGGVIVPPSAYLRRLKQLCEQHDILLIFDEVITGFGRMGEPFGVQAFGVMPDILNLAKGLTNGAIPMGAVVTTPQVFDAFNHSEVPDHMISLPHGYTYSGHPVACAAALAAMDIFVDEDMPSQARALAPVLEHVLHSLKGHAHIVDIRNVGLTGAIQIAPRDNDPLIRPYEVGTWCWDHGLYVRWGGDTLQFGPPFVSDPDDLEQMGETLAAAFAQLK
ncbi:MAG: aminotransferase class III-fold pyridoxal phosphate-dependent enzyme [Pseudomonadota bacterium]